MFRLLCLGGGGGGFVSTRPPPPCLAPKKSSHPSEALPGPEAGCLPHGPFSCPGYWPPARPMGRHPELFVAPKQTRTFLRLPPPLHLRLLRPPGPPPRTTAMKAACRRSDPPPPTIGWLLLKAISKAALLMRGGGGGVSRAAANWGPTNSLFSAISTVGEVVPRSLGNRGLSKGDGHPRPPYVLASQQPCPNRDATQPFCRLRILFPMSFSSRGRRGLGSV